VSDRNKAVIDEFRANDGTVGGHFEGATLLLLHSIGAKSGEARINPLQYQDLGHGYAIFASKMGAASHPSWYHNLRANPKTSIELGSDTVEVIARVADDEERAPIWERQKANRPQFAEYEAKTTREIPVVILEPVAG